MSNSDTINQQQEREAKVSMMDSMCGMNKGKQTYLNLTRRQWIDRFLEWNPATDPKELAEGDFHLVELAQACECQEDAADLVSVNSEDEETLHEYKGKKYLGKELLDLWETEADQAKQDYKEYEKANKPSAKKQKTAYEIPLRLVGSEMCIRDSYLPACTPRR